MGDQRPAFLSRDLVPLLWHALLLARLYVSLGIHKVRHMVMVDAPV